MSSTDQRKPAVEPDRELVELAIVEVLRLARRQGITVADFVQMLDSGMQMSDLLNAIDEPTGAANPVDSDAVN
jgi:hypothetical protein